MSEIDLTGTKWSPRATASGRRQLVVIRRHVTNAALWITRAVKTDGSLSVALHTIHQNYLNEHYTQERGAQD